MWITPGYPQVRATHAWPGPPGPRTLTGMSHLQLPLAVLSHLNDLLRHRPAEPEQPVLPGASRTGAALARAVGTWQLSRDADERALHDHLREVHGFARHALELDADRARILRGMLP